MKVKLYDEFCFMGMIIKTFFHLVGTKPTYAGVKTIYDDCTMYHV